MKAPPESGRSPPPAIGGLCSCLLTTKGEGVYLGEIHARLSKGVTETFPPPVAAGVGVWGAIARLDGRNSDKLFPSFPKPRHRLGASTAESNHAQHVLPFPRFRRA
jgi:hypothetical protein